mmetsp:Transcript_20556/g.34070  ORF Transcript_20556/g.34070 Transcript_20556/m.34070 type:complete len:153 (-) Transcript_20556:8-466(-)
MPVENQPYRIMRKLPIPPFSKMTMKRDEVLAIIKDLLETRIRQEVQEDGGGIRYVDFYAETGIVTLQLAGRCVGCPSNSVTFKDGVENMLVHYIPEVTSVQKETTSVVAVVAEKQWWNRRSRKRPRSKRATKNDWLLRVFHFLSKVFKHTGN